METDVIAIGAGMAGLAAAEALSESGRQVEILEARDRVGGRVLSRPSEWSRSGPAVELGAEFIHGHPPEIFERAKSWGLQIEKIPDLHHEWTPRGFVRIQDFWEVLDTVFQHLEQKKAKDQSLRKFFLTSDAEITPRARRFALSFIEGFYGADPDQLSEEFLATSERQAEATGMQQLSRLSDGYSTFAERLASEVRKRGVRISLRSEVQKVRWTPEGVSVDVKETGGTRTRTLRARCAVITLPIGVLKANPGLFDPPLSEKQQALQKTEMGEVIRVVFEFEQSFWKKKVKEPLSFIHSPEESIPIWWSSLPRSIPRLTAWVGGPKALELSRLENRQIVTEAMASLSRVLRVSLDDMEPLLIGAHFHSWHKDPFARGAYSYVRVGGMEDQKALAKPVGETLYFAGEAYYLDGQTGTVNAALASGQQTALRVLADHELQKKSA